MRVTRDASARAALELAIRELRTKQLRVGFFDTAKYGDGTPVAYVATIQELGYPAGNIPARPFLRPTVEQQRQAWKRTLAAGAKRVIAGKMTYSNMLGQFGMQVAGEVSESISKVTNPVLKDSTIAARRSRRKSPGVSTKPLVDTGLMIQSVSSKVEDV